MDCKANVKPVGNSRPIKPKKELKKTAAVTVEANDLTSLHKPNSLIILPADFKQRIETLQTCFQGTSSSTCVCYRPARSLGCFGHLGCSVKLCTRFAEMDRKLFERAKLVLMKYCLQRLQSSLEFIDELEKNLDLYVTMHKALLHSSQSKFFSWKTFPLKKEKFHDLCQSARIHIGHWSTLRTKIISDLHLRTQLPDLMRTLRTVQLRFIQNTEKICVLTGKLLLRAIEICHHLTWKIPQEAMKLLANSIDDFNDLLEFSYSSQSECEAIFSLYSLGSRLVAMLKERLTPHINLCYQHSLTCPISLTKLLNSVANERSRIFCAEVISYLTSNSELQKRLKTGFRYVFDWEEFVLMKESSLNERNSQQTISRNGILKVFTGTQIPVMRIEPDSLLSSFENEEKLFVNQLLACFATCRTLFPLGHSSHSGSANRHLVNKLVPSYPVPVEEVSKPAPLLPHEKSVAPHQRTDFGHSILKHRQSENSPKLGKRVQWSLTLNTAQKEQFCLSYMMAVWSDVAVNVCSMLGELSWNHNHPEKLTSFPLLSNTVTVMVVQLLEAMKNSGSLAIPGSQSLQLAARHLHCMVVVAFWDSEFCHLLGVTLNDKCKPSCELVDGQPSTKTVQSCLLLLEPLYSVFESATQLKCLSESYEPHSSQFPLSSETFASIVPSITRLHTLLSFCLYWFDTKLRQFLSAWTLEPLLLLIQWELPFLLDSMNRTLALVHSLCTSDMHFLGSTDALLDLWKDTQQKALALETLSRKSMSMFESDLKKMSIEYFRETMPQGKLWRKSRHSGAPFRPSPYAEHSVVQILEPVVASVAELSYDIQLSIMTLALNTMMEAWSEHILKEEVIFSFYGGQQIQLDFNHVKAWISSDGSGLPSGIQSHLLGLDVFKHLDGAVHLLMLQPRKKKQSANELDVELESNSSTVSSSSVISSLSGVDMEGYDLEVLCDTSIPNRQQWLDLRLRGGGKSKKGLMPFCLRTQET